MADTVLQKHTLYCVRGTGGRTSQQLFGQILPNYDQMIGRAVDKTVWNVVDVAYPGDQFNPTAFLQMDQTSGDGKRILIDKINSTPGRFALCGYSQGGIVVSDVYDEIRDGSLTSRRSDLIAGVTLGNPRRQRGHSIPGGVDPGGVDPHSGILITSLLEDTEDLWWDFVNDGDMVADISSDTDFGIGSQKVFQFLFENYTSPVSFIADTIAAYARGVFTGFIDTLDECTGIAEALVNLFLVGIDLALLGDSSLDTAGHLRYHFPYTNLSGNTTDSAVTLATNYFNEVGFATPLARVPAPVGAVSTTVPKTDSQMQAMNQQLIKGSLYARAAAADAMAEAQAPIDQQWRVTLCDKLWQTVGFLGDDVIELSGVDMRNNVANAKMIIKGSTEHLEAFMNCETTMVGVIVETGGLRMPFYVDTFDIDYEQDKQTCTANLLGIWDVLNYMQIWPNFLLPLAAQIPSDAVFIWGLVTVIETMVSECAIRMQSGIFDFLNQVTSLDFDTRTWFSTLLKNNGNIFEALKTPVYVVRGNPLTDGSPLVAKTVRMEACGPVIIDISKSYGVDTEVQLWLPGDEQPDAWANLDQPTYLVKVKDRSQIEGPTHTVLDSVIKTVVDVGGSFFGGIGPIFQGVPGMSGVFQSPVLGVNYIPPWPILVAPDQGQRGSVTSCKLSFHTPKGWQHIVGGRSPKWLNDLMNATFSWIIDSVSILLGVTGIPSNLLDGFLNNAFLAFQLIQDYNRRSSVGPYHPAMEVFHATASAPYNVETVFAFINALWDSRGYVSAQAMFRNGEVYTLGVDVFKGQLVSVLYYNRTRLFTDYIEMIHFRLTTTERTVMAQIGDGKAEESRLAGIQRLITGVMESINVLTLAPQS